MIELAVRPQHGVMTLLACSREAELDVVHRRGRVVVVGLVATHASRVRAGEIVVVIGVALSALRAGQVEARQWPARGRVIKRAVGPQHRVVTVLASCRETELDVVDRRGRIVVVGLMAADARCVRSRQAVVVIDVTLTALGAGEMEAGQRPPST